MTSPGDRSHLPLEEEPLPFLHPAEAGTVEPVHGIGARDDPLLEEEPAEWIDLAARPRPPLPRDDRPVQDPDGTAGGTGRPLPATGDSTPTGLAAAGLVAAWLLRRRTTEKPDGT